MRKATASQRKAYLKAINEKRPVPTGFVWDGIRLWVAPDTDTPKQEQDKENDEDASED